MRWMVELKYRQNVQLQPERQKQRLLLDWWWPQESEVPGTEALVWRVRRQDGRCASPWLKPLVLETFCTFEHLCYR